MNPGHGPHDVVVRCGISCGLSDRRVIGEFAFTVQ